MAGNSLPFGRKGKRLAEASRVADPDIMSQYRVEDDKAPSRHSTAEDIERRIRQALDERKLERALRPVPLGLGFSLSALSGMPIRLGARGLLA